MSKYRKASHTTYDCRYHIVWITKYRRDIFTNNKALEKKTKDLLQEISKEMYVKVIRLEIEKDHIHMYVSIPVSQPIPYVLQRLKGVSSRKINQEFREYLKTYYWKKNALWAVGYFIATVGEVNDKIIKHYIEYQGKKDVLGEDTEIEL